MERLWTTLAVSVCFGLIDGYVENVALQKPANMSSVYGVQSLPAGGAVDGNITTTWHTQTIHTAVNQPSAWWTVDLEKQVQTAEVKIYFRTDNKRRRNGVKLYTSTSPFSSRPGGQLCHTISGRVSGAGIPDVVSVNCTGTWRYLMIYTNTNNDGHGPILDFGEVSVLVCSTGTYGRNCSKHCGHCALTPTSCYRFTGACPAGCEVGWKLADCSRPCSNGTYGRGCNSTCGKCVGIDTCHHVNGNCSSGCQKGWRGIQCHQTCSNGTYGRGCNSTCGKCVGIDTCHHVTGNCSSGCQKGWRGIQCHQSCTNMTYGVDCKSVCGKCTGNDVCNHVTGKCPAGCKEGWRGIQCNETCSNATFGPDCNFTCGKCVSNDTCHHVTGNCPNGCEKGWRGIQCNQICASGTYGSGCNFVCGSCTGDDTCNHVTGSCPGGCKSGWSGTRCNEHLTGISPSRFLATVVGSAIFLLVIVTIVTVVIMYTRRGPSATGGNKRSASAHHTAACRDDIYVNTGKADSGGRAQAVNTDDLDLEEEEIVQEEEPSLNRDYCNEIEDLIRAIPVGELEETVEKIKHREGGFEAEYFRLPTGFMAPYEDSQRTQNSGKNKFKGYYPYDHNRVRLSLIPDLPGSDYINASIMHSADKRKTYIAAQAPIKRTLGDFWRMIWEYRCDLVVMLTSLVEDMKVKCHQYWPDDDIQETDLFHIKVDCTDVRANYTIRRLKVTAKDGRGCRTIFQYHYTSWPDHGVPDTLALVRFMWRIRRADTQIDRPLLVHCSAGIGRTGTYIAVDSLLDQARREGVIDIPGYVSEMRQQRKNMIQTKEQYECVFQCLVGMTTFGNTSMDVENFTASYSSRGMNTVVDRKTIREVTQMMRLEDCRESHAGRRVWVDGNQDFIIRAEPSLRNLHGYLLAVTPTPGLEKLLWKLVEENNVHNVIVMSQIQLEIYAGKCAKKKYGAVTVTARDKNNLDSELTRMTLQLQMANAGRPREVTLFTFSSPPSVNSLSTSLLNQTSLQDLSSENTPVVILHSESDQKSALLFCIMGNILSEIREDRLVDVIGHVRTFRRSCPELAVTEQEVAKIHDFAQKCAEQIEINSVYANM